MYDPYISNKEKLKYNFNLMDQLPINIEEKFNIVIVAVAHKEFKDRDKNFWLKLVTEENIIYDLKGIVPRELNTMRL